MPSSLWSMPPEVLDRTAQLLDEEGFHHLWRALDGLRQNLDTGRGVVKDRIAYSKEAKLALEKKKTYAQALSRAHVRRESIALARPYSVALLARGLMRADVKYSDGLLCYQHQKLVRILDVHGASETELVIDMAKLMAELPGYDSNSRTDDVESIFTHQNGILIMKDYTGSVNRGNPLMVVIDVRRDFVATPHSPSRRIMILQEPLPEQPQHVITDGRYLVCVNIPDNVSEWTLKCYDLSNTKAPASIIALNEFLPRGNECRFKLLDGRLYVICAHEEGQFVFERDHKKKLYYDCCRFPIDCPVTQKPEDFLGPSSYTPLPARLEAVRLHRGVGEVAWKHVCSDLVRDERTGEIFIVESASFAKAPESDTPYRRLRFPESLEHTVSSWETKISEIVQTIDLSDDVHRPSHYKMRPENIRKHVHPSHSIMDVTYDRQVLHLYASSPDRGVWRFPPLSPPDELSDFLTQSGTIFAHADERSLIVMIVHKVEDLWCETQLILVNFDSAINFPGFRYLPLDNPSDKLTADDNIDETGAGRSKDMRQLQDEFLQLNEKARREAEAPDAHEAEAPDANTWFYTEPALHLKIKKGYQFQRYTPKSTADNGSSA